MDCLFCSIAAGEIESRKVHEDDRCVAFEDIMRAIDVKPGHRVFGLSIVAAPERTVFIADTAVHETPSAEHSQNFASGSMVLSQVYLSRISL